MLFRSEQLMQKIDKHEKTIKKLHRSLLAKQDGSLEEATVALEEGIPEIGRASCRERV